MIKAIIFDLDGTLVQTEILKAESYARAIREMSSFLIEKEHVIEAYKAVVGRSQQEVAETLLDEFSSGGRADEDGRSGRDYALAGPLASSDENVRFNARRPADRS